MKVIPERRFQDRNKRQFDITAEIFQHTRNKSMENRNKLYTLYEEKPFESFDHEHDQLKRIMKDDITHPVGYVDQRRTFQSFVKKGSFQ